MLHRLLRRHTLHVCLALASVVALVALTVAPAAAVAPRNGTPPPSRPEVRGEVKPQPEIVLQREKNKIAAANMVVQDKVKGKQGKGHLVKLPSGDWVEHELEGTDHIVTLLAEFDDPMRGQIAEPDRSVDNSTYWVPNFDRQHYQDMLFAPGGGSYGMPSMRDFYLEQSSGTYTVEGQVSNWVHIPQAESAFGANGPSGAGSDNANGPVYRVIQAALNATAGVSDLGIDWSKADVWDRYDCDGDGNFDEPDGYVDHFQVIHAGQGEEEGGGAQGEDAIWSHRWYANFNQSSGPAGCQLGGYQVPGTNLWVGDYTIEPENGGVGVFSHEFGHDLGLPDLYDTAGGENGTGFWTIMSSGSWASADPNAIGTSPVHMGAWEKLVLGWLNYAVAVAGDDSTTTIGPAEGDSTSGAQALVVVLPPYQHTESLIPPEGGDPNYYYSGSGNNLDNTMSRALDSPLAAASTLTFRAWYDIEQDWDYAYVEYSTDGGQNWTQADGNLSTDTDPNGQNQGHGITGSSGGWVDGSYTLPAGTTNIRFRYWTDVATIGRGFIVDSIAIGSWSDNGSDQSWTFDGFSRIENGEVSLTYNHYYIAESRSYVRMDVNLQGAYNFIEGNWLEKQPYADGVLISYWNTRFTDNNTSVHPGEGLILPVDSHPMAARTPLDDGYLRQRWQTWDATFGIDQHKIKLHQVDSRGKWVQQQYKAKPVRAFVDSAPDAYYDPAAPQNSVLTAGSGVHIEITGYSKDRTTYQLHVY